MALILVMQNVSSLAPVSDYKWQAYINDRVIAEGHVTGHTRSDGWRVLVEKVLAASTESRPAGGSG